MNMALRELVVTLLGKWFTNTNPFFEIHPIATKDHSPPLNFRLVKFLLYRLSSRKLRSDLDPVSFRRYIRFKKYPPRNFINFTIPENVSLTTNSATAIGTSLDESTAVTWSDYSPTTN
jgi:hypothetical protein